MTDKASRTDSRHKADRNDLESAAITILLMRSVGIEH
jgi:hypothetical protein